MAGTERPSGYPARRAPQPSTVSQSPVRIERPQHHTAGEDLQLIALVIIGVVLAVSVVVLWLVNLVERSL